MKSDMYSHTETHTGESQAAWLLPSCTRDPVTQRAHTALHTSQCGHTRFAPSAAPTRVPRTPLIKKGAEAPQYAHSTGASKTAWRLLSNARLCLHTEQCMWAGKLYHPPIDALGSKSGCQAPRG